MGEREIDAASGRLGMVKKGLKCLQFCELSLNCTYSFLFHSFTS